MWLITALLVVVIFLLLVIIMDTAMKLALMITTLYNYDTKKTFYTGSTYCSSLGNTFIWMLQFNKCFLK